MSDAPETIWAWVSKPDDHPHHPYDQNEWCNADSPHPTGSPEYTRTDLCIPLNDPALVALVEAVEPVMKMELMTETAGNDEIVIMSAKTIKNMRTTLAAFTARMEGKKP